MQNETDPRSKALLVGGFLALTAGIIAGYTDPATGYELSIYSQTPLGFWIGVGVAMMVAVLVSLIARTGGARILGLVLGCGAFAAIVGLPILRNYHYYGYADALTHLAWARGVVSGEQELLSLLYPGIHTFAAFLDQLMGYSMTRSMLYVVFFFALVFILFVPLCTWMLTRNPRVVVIATFSAFMLLPINNISTQMNAHTTTQTLMFVPLVMYLFVRYLRSEPKGIRKPTAAGLFLAVGLVSLVFYHPQQALNILLILTSIAAVQLFVRWRQDGQSADEPRTVYAQTGILAVVWSLWSWGHERAQSSVSIAVADIETTLFGQSGIAAETAQQGASLAEIGASLSEIFLKVFSVMSVYTAIVAAVLLMTLTSRFAEDKPILRSFNRYIVVAFIPLTAVFVLYFAASIGTQAYRHLGFLMVLVTIIGAVGIGRGWQYLEGRLPGTMLRTFVAVGLVIALAVSLVAVFPSPWIYEPTQHVTKMQLNGHETAFDHTPGDAEFLGVRSGPHRYADAYYNRSVDERWFGKLNESAMLTNISEQYGTDIYYTLTRLDRERDINAYKQLRYSQASFEQASNQRGVNKVIDNGEFKLYYVPK